MLKLTLLSITLALSAQERHPGHETAEDKARTTPGAASLGVKACHQDIERWCKDVKPGEGRLGACLLAHKEKLSKRCRKWARHGGAALEDAAYREIDSAPKQPASQKTEP